MSVQTPTPTVRTVLLPVRKQQKQKQQHSNGRHLFVWTHPTEGRTVATSEATGHVDARRRSALADRLTDRRMRYRPTPGSRRLQVYQRLCLAQAFRTGRRLQVLRCSKKHKFNVSIWKAKESSASVEMAATVTAITLYYRPLRNTGRLHIRRPIWPSTATCCVSLPQRTPTPPPAKCQNLRPGAFADARACLRRTAVQLLPVGDTTSASHFGNLLR